LRSRISSTVVVGATLTVLAAALRFVDIGHQGFWFDEGNTVLLVHYPLGKMFGLIPQTESTPPLYYAMAWVWARLFGFGEAGMRSLSAVAGVATVPVAYATARKLISQRVGLIVAALAAFNPFLIWYSQEVRSYSLLVFLAAMSLLTFAYALEAPTGRRLAAWAVASALALATHYYAVLVVAPEAAWLLLTGYRRPPVQLGVAAVAACGLALLPLALSQNGTGNDSWIASAPLGPRLRQLVPQFVIGTGSPAYHVLEPFGSALALIGLILLIVRGDAHERRRALVPGSVATGGFVLDLVLVAAGFDDLITRNVIALWLPAAIAVAAGFGAARVRVAGPAAVTALCAIGVVATVGVVTERNLERPNWRAVANVLGAPPPAGRAVLLQHYRDRLPLSLYMPSLRLWRSARPERIDQLDVIAISSPQQPLCWWGAACNLIPSRIQRSYAIPGFREAWERRTLQFTVMQLDARRPEEVSPTEIAHALTATKLPHDGLLFQS
jgi:mannosyltransferase